MTEINLGQLLDNYARAYHHAMHPDAGGDLHDRAHAARKALVDFYAGLKPELPPRPPDGEGLPRYGLLHGKSPLSVPMEDGYWTPWHLAQQFRVDALRYRWLRYGDNDDAVLAGDGFGLIFILRTTQLDEKIDQELVGEVAVGSGEVG